MRTLTLNVSEDKGDFVESVSASAPAVIPPLTQGDTVRLAVTKVVRPENPTATLDAFIVKPWSFSEIRFSLGYIDKAPESGTFKLHVGSSTTGALTWPADPTDAAAVVTWKAGIVTAINAIAGTGAVRLSDPANTPANFIYLTWTSPTDNREITLVENRLVPAINTDEAVTNTNALPAYEQLIKLSRLPLVETVDFAFPSPVAPTIAREVTGASGANEVQIIALNSAAVGAFDLTWSGAHTAPLSITGLTAAQIAAALNAIVVDGASNPSFSVSARTSAPGTTKFAVSFIGPLAAAPQSYLVAAALQTETELTAYGTVELRRELFERALNGAASTSLLAELVIVDGGGESTILRTLTLLNDMTGPGTESAIGAGGGILTLTTTVYIDESTADPFVTAAAGLAYTVPIGAVGASSISVPHTDFASALVGVRVHKQTSSDPEVWVECKETEYGNSTTDPFTHTVVTFPFLFVNDADSDFHYAKWKILLTDPDATVALSAFKMAWDDVLESLPSGQTLTAKLAAVEAAIGVFSGALTVAAANISGTLAPAQIDSSALATALVGKATFAAALQSLFATSPATVDALVNQLSGSATFLTAFNSTIASNTSVGDTIAAALASNNTFESTLQSLVLDIIQSTGNIPAGQTLYVIDPVDLRIPLPLVIPAAPTTRTVSATEESTVTSGDTSTKVVKPVTVQVSTPATEPVYQPLSQARPGLTSGGTKTGRLPETDAGTSYYTVVTSATSRTSASGRRGTTFADGAKIAFKGHWFEVVLMDGAWYPREYEQTIVPTLSIDAAELYAGSRLSLDVPMFLQLAGNCVGRLSFLAEIGPDTADLPTIGTFTVVAATNVITTSAAHGLAIGDRVRVSSTVTLPGGLAAATDYYVLTVPSGTTLTVSATSGGAVLDITDTGTGTHTMVNYTASAESVNAVTWSTIFEYTARVSAVTRTLRLGVQITKPSPSGAATGAYLINGRSTVFTPPASAPFRLRLRMTKFDCETIAAPVGSLSVRIPEGAALASIIAL
jgi:hypothetical protein